MNKFFLLCLSLSVSGSLIAVTLALLKPLLQRFGKTWQYYLWLLVILRLLVPFAPSAGIVGGVFQSVETRLVTQQTAESAAEMRLSETTSAPVLPASENVYAREADLPFHVSDMLKASLPGIIWLGVAVGLLVRKIVGYARFMKAMKQESRAVLDGPTLAVLQSVSEAMGVKKRVRVCTNELARAPMLAGFVQPMIVLPSEAAPPCELTLILRHELTHACRMDFLYKWLVEIAVCLHWFNPLVYWVRKQVNQDCELSCDESVLSCLDSEQRQIYGETLLNAIAVNQMGGASSISFALSKDGKLMKARLNAIMGYRRKSKWVAFAASVTMAVLLLGSISVGAYTLSAVEKTNASLSPQSGRDALQPRAATAQTVAYQTAELRRGGGDFVYVAGARVNHTRQKIVSCDRAMLAYDQDGNPLALDWWARDEEINAAFLWVHSGFTNEVPPGQKEKQTRGWRLNAATDPQVQNVAYVLFCDKKMIFEDGTVWENSAYEKWRSTYEGKKTDVSVLKNYYPYEEKIVFGEAAQANAILSDSGQSMETMASSKEEDIQRLTIEDISPALRAAVQKLENDKWYVMESGGRQYIYYNNLQRNYAYQYEAAENTVRVVDIGKFTDSYVLLSVPQGFDLLIYYNEKAVLYTKPAV